MDCSKSILFKVTNSFGSTIYKTDSLEMPPTTRLLFLVLEKSRFEVDASLNAKKFNLESRNDDYDKNDNSYDYDDGKYDY